MTSAVHLTCVYTTGLPLTDFCKVLPLAEISASSFVKEGMLLCRIMQMIRREYLRKALSIVPGHEDSTPGYHRSSACACMLPLSLIYLEFLLN